MKSFDVDDDLVARVWELSEPAPFEHLSFSDALRRVLEKLSLAEPAGEKEESLREIVDRMIAEGRSGPKRAPSPNPTEWAAQVPELGDSGRYRSWKDICMHLGVDPAGDSARRKLRNWVSMNKPHWPEVPAV